MAGIDNMEIVSLDSNDAPTPGTSADDDDKPLMSLFKRLIGNDTKQNTVLTNAQIVDILKKEFLMDISYIHDLEIEIYLNLMKKFLKDWPQWDDFDHTIQTMKTQSDDYKMKEQLELETNYFHLKQYLSKMLGTAKPLIKIAVDQVKEIVSKDNPQRDSDVVLEISCSREELNKLFYRRPHPDFYDTIFRVQPSPAKIKLYTLTLKSILNWPNVSVMVNLGAIIFKRDTVSLTKRKLVNKKLNNVKEPLKEINTGLAMKTTYTQSMYTLREFFNVLNKPSTIFPSNVRPIAMAIFDILKEDLTCELDVQIPAQFRRHLSKYPYVRYCYSEVTTEKTEPVKCNSYAYDLQLEETITPKMSLNISKFDKFAVRFSDNWLQVKCIECNVQFTDWSFKTHFEVVHQGEGDWQCLKCNKTLPMVELCDNSWKHVCEEVTSSRLD